MGSGYRNSKNMSKTILISACLVGTKCSYDGESRLEPEVKKISKEIKFIAVCPEILGNMGCPRSRHEIIATTGEEVLCSCGTVVSSEGEDHSRGFIEGAKQTLLKVEENDIKVAIMKARSPSCGKGAIYSGNFDGKLKKGNGVTAALLLCNGVQVFTEEEIDAVKKAISNS